MSLKLSKYNVYSLSYKLFFSFSDTFGNNIDNIKYIGNVVADLLPSTQKTKYCFELVEQGLVVTINSTVNIDIPKLVNRVKTHSSKRFYIDHPVLLNREGIKSLWRRGYFLTTLGEKMSAEEGFSLLKSKKIQLIGE